MLSTPILFLVFNRPDTTIRVLEQIRIAKPGKLYIAADGFRSDRVGEEKACKEVIRLIENGIDWPCEVHRLYRASNLGVKKAISGAITWFFDHVDAGIILEDDCLPDQSFFRFCAEMLERYKSDDHIYHIAGNNFQSGLLRGESSYYFSKYAHIWGWATWRRAWKNYDVDMSDYKTYSQSEAFKDLFQTNKEMKFWHRRMSTYVQDRSVNNYWALQWLYTCWRNGGLSIIPNANLVTNIGFGGGTNTTTKVDHLIVPARELLFPLKHPGEIKIDREADLHTFQNVFAKKGSIWSRIRYRFNNIITKGKY